MLTNTAASWLGWYYIPRFATEHVLRFFYSVSKQTPQPGTPTYQRHWRYTYALIVLAYLSYNLYESANSMESNFYQVLNVPSDVDEDGLKSAFRAFARRNHPDRPGVGPEGAELFIRVRDVFEALKNPTVRFAYDR